MIFDIDVKKYREQIGLTQDQLASNTKISREKIAKWEQGKAKPKPEDHAKLRKFFQLRGVDIYGEWQEALHKEADTLVVKLSPKIILANARRDQNYTLTQMAEKLGISEQEYKRIEAGKFENYDKPTIQHIDKLLGTHLYDSIFEIKYDTYYSLNHLVSQVHEDSGIYVSVALVQVPYLPVYTQASYLRHYAVKGKEMDKDLEHIPMPKEPEDAAYMIIEIAGNSMNNKTEKAICDGDKLLLKEIEKDAWKKTIPNYKHEIFVIFTATEGILCRALLKQDIRKGIFTFHAWNNRFVNLDIPIANIYRLFCVKKIVERRVGF